MPENCHGRGGRHLFNKKPRPDIDNHMIRVGKLALDVERVGQGDEDVFFFCRWLSSALGWKKGRGGEGPTVKSLGPRLHHPQALLELGLRRRQLRVRPRQVLDLLVELLLDGCELLGAEGVEGD